VYPRLLVDLNKIEHNAKNIVEMCHMRGQSVAVSTKLVMGNPMITATLLATEIEYIADSRIENLIKTPQKDKQKILLRIPSLYDVERVMKGCDITFHSNLESLKAFEQCGSKVQLHHGVVLMVDMGDLREGIWYEDEKSLIECVEWLEECEWLELKGIATNITCFGGVLPSKENIELFKKLCMKVEKKIKRTLEIKSFGNSSSIDSLELLENVSNHIRIGEAIFLGRETAHGAVIKGCVQNAFILEAEVIEVYAKPSLPFGEIGRDSFGNVPKYEDRGIRKRAVVAIGRQDILEDRLIPLEQGIEVLGASSDHLLLDVNAYEGDLHVGDILKFSLTYGGVLSLFTSPFVEKIIKK